MMKGKAMGSCAIVMAIDMWANGKIMISMVKASTMLAIGWWPVGNGMANLPVAKYYWVSIRGSGVITARMAREYIGTKMDQFT